MPQVSTWLFRSIRSAVVVLGLAVGFALPAQDPGDLFESVVERLERGYWNRKFRREELPKLAAKFRSAAEAAVSLQEECAIIDGFLARVPSSHLAMFSERSFRGMMADLTGRRSLRFGFQLQQKASHFFVCKILEGGPADRAGLKRGDRVVSIDGLRPHASPRLGRRTDDAYLPDPPLHDVVVRLPSLEDEDEDEDAPVQIRLEIASRPGAQRKVTVTAARYSALLAARASARVVERGGKKIGYVHFSCIHSGCVRLLNTLRRGAFAECDSLVLDLRGRGGNGQEAMRIVDFFAGPRRRWRKPMVALIDKGSRSAKELLAYEFRKKKAGFVIGEKTAGALVPASFVSVGQGMILMYPTRRLPKYSDLVELQGVEPDRHVAYPLAFTAGADPILAAALEKLAR